MSFLKADLEDADDEVERLEEKLITIQQKDGIFLTKDILLTRLKRVISESLHSITITTPTIYEIGKLDLFEVPSSITIKIACDIEVGNPVHQEIVDELEAFDNISIRVYSDRDRYCALRDGEEIFFGAIGNNIEQLLVFNTTDIKHIQLFNTLANESWLRGKKLP